MSWRLGVIFVTLSWSFLETQSSCPKCTTYEIDHTPSTHTAVNKYLKGFIVTSMFVLNLESCFLSCIYDFCQCASMNYRTSQEQNGSHLCELNYETKLPGNLSSLIAKNNFLFVDVVAYNSSKVSDVSRWTI